MEHNRTSTTRVPFFVAPVSEPEFGQDLVRWGTCIITRTCCNQKHVCRVPQIRSDRIECMGVWQLQPHAGRSIGVLKSLMPNGLCTFVPNKKRDKWTVHHSGTTL